MLLKAKSFGDLDFANYPPLHTRVGFEHATSCEATDSSCIRELSEELSTR